MALTWAPRWLAMLSLVMLAITAFSAHARAEEPAPAPDADDPVLVAEDRVIEERERESPPTQATQERERQTVITDTESPNYMGVIARNAFLGGVTGGLVGTGVYLLSGREYTPWTIAYVAGGGILVGAAAGIVELSVREQRTSDALAARRYMLERELPKAVNVPLLKVSF
ncbi:hypothetical protein DL240_01845 [Lujinxingia litoralis]|uniref:Glycine zipper family protein n=1 Tax=Lujinxingia litoralis TaxID=2211119 RepID=A0A328C8N5_9DELT|nr:hypothetical protein [Lujinxingia litoralis]RAL24977.1 hypothetical protein DL240_01845 [Lujinxingia litoralis]